MVVDAGEDAGVFLCVSKFVQPYTRNGKKKKPEKAPLSLSKHPEEGKR